MMDNKAKRKRPALPLRAAYPFGVDRGLGEEIRAIQPDLMPIRKWTKSYTSSVRRGHIIELFRRHDIFDEFKRIHWPFGNTSSGIVRTEQYLHIKQEYEKHLTGNH